MYLLLKYTSACLLLINSIYLCVRDDQLEKQYDQQKLWENAYTSHKNLQSHKKRKQID